MDHRDEGKVRADAAVGESTRTTDEAGVRLLASGSRVAAVLVGVVAASYLAAWLTGAMFERGGTVITMKTNTAVCLLLLAVGLALLQGRAGGGARRFAGRLCAATALVIGVLTFVENLAGWNVGIDELLATEAPRARGMVFPNRMGSPASLSAVLLGTALLLHGRRRDGGVGWEQALAVGACIFGLLPTIGYLYGVEWLYGFARVSAIAWPTALCIIALGVGLLCARPSEGLMGQVVARDAGGMVVRQLLVPALLLPIVLGGLQIVGQRLGWFDPRMGTALLALVFVLSLTSLAWLTGRRTSRAAAELAAQQELLGVTLKSIGDAVIACDLHGRVTFINPIGAGLTGWTHAEAVGRTIHDVFKVVDERSCEPAEDIVARVLREGQVVELTNHTAIVARSGILIPIEDSAAPIRDTSGAVSGAVVVFHDAKDKRRAVEALRESEYRFRLALRNAPVSLAAQDGDLKYIWAYNQKTTPPGGIMGLRDDEIFTREEAERVTAMKRRVLDEGVEVREQMWFARPAGRIFLDVCCEPLRDEAGRVIGVTSATVDLTARKIAEDALRRSEEKFAKAFRGNTSAMAITRLSDGVSIDVNNRYLEMTGFAREQVIGRPTAELGIWRAAADRDAFVSRLRDTGEVRNAEYQFRRPDGSEWTGVVSAELSEIAGEQVIISSIADITQRKRQERRVEELSRLYAVLSKVNETIVRTRAPQVLYQDVCDIIASDGQRPLVWIGLVDGRRIVPVAAAGPALDYLRGLRVEVDGEFGQGPSGTSIREDRSVVNDDFDQNPSTQPWRDAALKHNLRASASFPIRHQASVIGALTLYATQAGTFDRAQVGLLEALSADLSYALDKMAQERALQESEQSLREEDRRKDEFLAMLSHELRNPLAPIRSAIYILERATPGGERARRAHAIIDRQVAHMTRLVEDLLDVTRISRGKIRLQREKVDLAELVRRVVEDHRGAFVAAGLALHVAIPQGPIPVDADRTRIAQAIGNLLQNASKFTPPSGRVAVSVETSAHEGQAVVRVRDNGSGIANEMLPRIFEPFTQADRTLDRSSGGLGLGLALVKGLVELHQGQVRVSSDGPGKGAEFVVRLPLDPGGAAPSTAGEPPATAGGRAARSASPRRVLVIEDNSDTAESLQALLELGGHEVRVACNGRDGLEVARRFAPHVVLCDIGLPGMDGYEVARAFRADPSLCAVVLVAVSGYALQNDLQRAAAAGFDRHLAKPASPEAIEQVLAAAGDKGRDGS